MIQLFNSKVDSLYKYYGNHGIFDVFLKVKTSEENKQTLKINYKFELWKFWLKRHKN